MKMFVLFISLFLIAGCAPQPGEQQAQVTMNSVNVDSLSALFSAGWNSKDSAAIMNTIAEDAIVMNDSLIHRGHAEIAAQWVSGGVKVLRNIKTVSSIKDAGDRIAFDGGTYSLDLNIPGGPSLKERGNYSLVWAKDDQQNWKLKLIHIEDITRLPDIK